MDRQPTTTDLNHHYQSTTQWSSSRRSSATSASGQKPLAEKPGALPVDLRTLLFPQHYQAQLLHYNRLISPGRGGGGGGLTTPPLPPILSSPHIQATPRPRSASKVSNKESQNTKPSGASNCHGNRGNKHADNSDRAVTMARDKASKAPPKQADMSHPLPARPPRATQPTVHPTQTSSVPSTPHQHARNHSIFPESHETSPNATQNHSPRSAYSETNSTLPSLRPLPPRLGGCKYETALARGRRRMPYSLGTDRLEKSDLGKIKNKLSEADTRKLTADMREMYDRLKPTEKSSENRSCFVSKLDRMFNEEWPGHNIRVHLFGSSGNKLYSDDSDVDICITTDWKDLENVCMIAELLAKRGMEKVVCVSSAKVPIIKMWDPELKLACDMNVNNTLALENTRMVLTYVEIDDRVRELAMIVKYWTRRRIINDAAFGGTLSSYTWMCMIISFLQLRKPPVLPALHQRLHQRRPAVDGHLSEFADDLDKLRGFGDENKESVGELLFQFFRFYAHEFDYDKFALSVRLGKLVTKTEKEWHRALNNMLCVEEPFNTIRNLGNTADDTSFRGLHMELRRAFDFISEAKFEECCEQFVFPKEEERVWQKPASAPRPILLRSSSQQQSTARGGRGNFRGGRQFHRNGNNNRRASSSVTYENNNPVYTQGSLPVMTPQDLQWYQNQAQAGQYPLHGDIINSALSALQIQEQTLRFQLYTQYTQSQAYAQQQALQHAQRMQGGGTQTGDRSRTNSFDNPPLTAPIRPEIYMYPMPLQQQFYTHNGQAAFTTYPSSPSTTNGLPEFRRSLHRASVTAEPGASSGTGTLRSQSQPASRNHMPGLPVIAGYSGVSGVPNYTSSRHVSIGPTPGFIPDEGMDSEVDVRPHGIITDSPTEEESTRYVGYYVNDSTTPTKATMPIPTALPIYGEASSAGQGRRRLSTDQLPQTILDRRMRRTSRSPSPLGHSRAFSVGTGAGPLATTTFAPTGNAALPKETPKPVVVNGSLGGSSRQPSMSESITSEDVGPYDNPLQISQGHSVNGTSLDQPNPLAAINTDHSPPFPDRPLVVNGSSSASATPQTPQDHQSFNQRMAYLTTFTPSPYQALGNNTINGMTQIPSMNRQRGASRQQTNGIAPLDLAIADPSFAQEMQHLSPVYETRTPSPTVTRRFDGQVHHVTPTPAAVPAVSRENHHKDQPAKSSQKASTFETHAKHDHQPQHHSHQKHHPRTNGNAARENGHVRAAKSDSDHTGGWQKSKSRKKGGDAKNTAANQTSHAEPPPKNEADRKGG